MIPSGLERATPLCRSDLQQACKDVRKSETCHPERSEKSLQLFVKLSTQT
jgi:hypothetical protein